MVAKWKFLIIECEIDLVMDNLQIFTFCENLTPLIIFFPVPNNIFCQLCSVIKILIIYIIQHCTKYEAIVLESFIQIFGMTKYEAIVLESFIQIVGMSKM